MKLGEVVSFQKGKKPSDLTSEQTEVTPFPYIDIKAFEKNIYQQYTSGQKSILCDEGDIVIVWDGARSGLIGKTPKGAIGSTLAKVIPDEILEPDYLFHFLRKQYDYLNKNTKGTGIPHIDPQLLSKIEIEIPPIKQQKQIVAKLDTLLGRVKSAQERLQKIPVLLKQFRQRVLEDAVSGKLTEDWRTENSFEDSEALENIISYRRKQYNTAKLPRGLNGKKDYTIIEIFPIPSSWQWTVIDQIGVVSLGGTPSRKNDSYWNGKINWVSSGEVNNSIILKTTEKITQFGLENSNAKIYPRDTVLIAMIGEGKTRGQSAILGIDAATNQNIAGVIIDNPFVVSKYLWYYLLSSYDKLRGNASGGAQPALNSEKVGEILFPLPPVSEQLEIIHRIESLIAISNQIESRYQILKAQFDQLPQAILAKAFRGELM